MQLNLRHVLQLLHLHGEHESRALVRTIGDHVHLATALLNNPLAHTESHSDTVLVQRSGASNFAKLLQDIGHLFGRDSFSCVDDVNFELFTSIIVRRHNLDLTVNCKLKRVFSEVY